MCDVTLRLRQSARWIPKVHDDSFYDATYPKTILGQQDVRLIMKPVTTSVTAIRNAACLLLSQNQLHDTPQYDRHL